MNTENEKKKKRNIRREILEWFGVLGIAVFAALFLDNVLLVNAMVPSGSMQDTIMPGDRIIGSRLSYLDDEPQRFDIIIFRYPDNKDKTYIKRIIGLPGETVEITDGEIYIDGSEEPLDDSFLSEPMQGSFGTFHVPEECYFVMGDNRNNSFDSRFWDNPYVVQEDILGKAYLRYWPLNSLGIVE